MSIKTSKTMIFMTCIDVLLVALTIFFAILYHNLGRDWMLSVYVTMLTISYHFVMRLIVGQAVVRTLCCIMSHRQNWYTGSSWDCHLCLWC